MHLLLLILGALVLLAVLADAFWTTLMPRGAGLVTRGVAGSIGRIGAGDSVGSSLRRSLAGPTSLTGVIVVWLAMLWTGWWMVMSGLPLGVLHAETEEPATLVDRLYYSGFTVSTLGVGDFVPGSTAAKVLTPIAAFSGFALITLSITFVIPVINSVVKRQQLTMLIADLGTDPHDMVRRYRDADGFSSLARALSSSIWPSLCDQESRHWAYPIVHQFRPASASQSLAVRLSVLYDTLCLVRHGLAPEARPAGPAFDITMSSITRLLDTIAWGFVRKNVEATADPLSLDPLRRNGVPCVSDAEFADAMGEAERVRDLLRAFVVDSGLDTRPAETPRRHARGGDRAPGEA